MTGTDAVDSLDLAGRGHVHDGLRRATTRRRRRPTGCGSTRSRSTRSPVTNAALRRVRRGDRLRHRRRATARPGRLSRARRRRTSCPARWCSPRRPGPVDLRHLSQWWTWTPGRLLAATRRARAARSSDRPDHPVVHVAHEDAARVRRLGRRRRCRPRPSGSTPRAAASTAPRSPGATSRGPAAGSWPTPGTAPTSRGGARGESGWHAHVAGRQLPGERLRAVRHGRQRLGVDRRLVDQPPPRGRRHAVLRPGEPARRRRSSRATTPPAAVPDRPQGDQGRLAPVRRHLLPALPTGRPPAADDRHRHEPRRLPLRTTRGDPMPETDLLLPSWRPGPTRDAVVAFLDAATTVPVEQPGRLLRQRRHAVVRAPVVRPVRLLRRRAQAGRRPTTRVWPRRRSSPRCCPATGRRSPSSACPASRWPWPVCAPASRPRSSPPRCASSWAGPTHATLGRPILTTVYQPMLELLDDLRSPRLHDLRGHRRGHRVRAGHQRRPLRRPAGAGGGDACSSTTSSDADDHPTLVRSTRLFGEANEGAAKVSGIQTQLGRRPILAVGNSGGDRADARLGRRRVTGRPGAPGRPRRRRP